MVINPHGASGMRVVANLKQNMSMILTIIKIRLIQVFRLFIEIGL